jgi:thiamine kinase-like enzyme
MNPQTIIDTTMPFLEEALDLKTAQEKLRILESIPCQAMLQSARLLRHKVGRRCLIEYTFSNSEPNAPPWVILGKARSRGLDRTSVQCQQELWAAGFNESSADGISVPETLGTMPEWGMWFQRKIPGSTTFKELESPQGIPIAQQVGRALAKLHNTHLPCQRHHTVADELRILHERLPKLLVTYPQWERRLARLLEQCDLVGAAIPPPLKPVGIHRDFYPDQVLISPDGRLYLLDFDLYCMGDPALDIGNFTAHLTEYSLRTTGNPNRFHPQAMASREQAMQHLDHAVSQGAIAAYEWLTLVRHIYISSLFRDRAPFTESLLQFCEESRLTHV